MNTMRTLPAILLVFLCCASTHAAEHQPAQPWTNGAKLGMVAASVSTAALIDLIKNRGNSKLGKLWHALRTSSPADILAHLKRNKIGYGGAVVAYFMLRNVLAMMDNRRDHNRRLIGSYGHSIGIRELLVALVHWGYDRQPGLGGFTHPMRSIERQRYPGPRWA